MNNQINGSDKQSLPANNEFTFCQVAMKLINEVALETNSTPEDVLRRAIRKEYWIHIEKKKGGRVIFDNKKDGMREVILD